MSYKLSKKQMMGEIVKCGKDPIHFINNYAKITHPQRGLISFNLYDFQEEAIENFNDHRFNVILKARQLGISTVSAAYVVWLMLFHREKNVLVIATKFSTASNLVKKVKSILKNVPDWLMIAKVTIDNRTSFELSNGSQIKASSTSGDAGRSEALSLLVIDEAAHVEGLEELWMGLYPTLSTGGRCIALSTPNGVGNWFHKIYTEAEQKINDFYHMKLPWARHPDRDQAWFEKETRNMSRREIAQELECNFNMSGETVFHGDDISIIQGMIVEPKYRTGFDRNYWIWEEYQPSCNYMISADVARGDGRDYSVSHVFKLDTMEIVAEYQGKVTPDIFSEILLNSGREYGNCLMVVENNSVGYSVLEKLRERGYPNIYYSIKSSHDYIDPIQAEYKSNSVAGFTTSSKTRPLIIAKMEEFIRNKLIKIYSSRLLNEMKTFIWNNGKAEAMRSYNDDLVMACSIGCWVRDTALIENQRNTEYKKAIIGSMRTSNTTINTSIPGMRNYKKDGVFDKINQTKKTHEQFPWLFKG
tara:strand:+ start:14496 stop:16082 length:1587 start_codon:yes stop_codon:yes gene_type:complete